MILRSTTTRGPQATLQNSSTQGSALTFRYKIERSTLMLNLTADPDSQEGARNRINKTPLKF